MKILSKVRKAVKLSKEDGFQVMISILKFKYGIPQSANSMRKAGFKLTIRFWDNYFRTKGSKWADSY